MKLRIEEAELRALLNRRAGQIGYRQWWAGVIDVFAGLGYPIAAFSAPWPLAAQLPVALIGLVYAVVGAVEALKSGLHRYTADDLWEDIKDMDRTEKRSSIVAVRDASGQYANRYLLYHDVRWNCDFFPNNATEGNVDNEQKALADYLSNTFEIPREQFTLRFVRGEMTHTKPSLSHGGVLRDYVYRLWVADVTELPVQWRADTFTVGGLNCRWETIAGMEADETIMKVNSDVVGMVKGYVH